MKNFISLIIFCFGILAFSCSQQKNTVDGSKKESDNRVVSGIDKDVATYKNPVFAEDFPDPAVVRVEDGWYYAYATQSYVKGKLEHIQTARSKDLINWERLGDAMPEKPGWAESSFWAPHVFYDKEKGKYYMYYSGESNDKTTGKCLGVAVSDSPEGPFIDKGEPLLCGKDFVNIDPMAFDDPKTGKKLLYWGSGFEPIKVQELTDDRLSFKEGTKPVDVVFPGKDKDYNILIEGAWVIFRNDKYYLFYSGDNCCGDNAHYAVMVARADTPLGPFTRFGEANGTGSSVILGKSEDWLAPGHNSIVQDDSGQDWIAYHAINTNDRWLKKEIKDDRKDRRILLIDRIEWENGWPIVKNKHPTALPVPIPVLNH